MGAIVLDANKVNSYVLPSLDKSKNTMREAYSTGQSLKNTLPSNFRYRSAVNDIVTQIYNIRKEINDVDTIIEKKVERATAIERKGSSNVSAIASKIGSVVGTVGGAAVGAATGGLVGTVVGAVVGNQVGSSAGKALANTGAKIVDGATKVAKGIWNGIKNFGKAIWDGGAKIVNSAASWVKDKALPWIKNAASAIWNGLSWLQTQYNRLKATITNLATSILEGVVSFIEAIGDVVLLVVGGVCSIFTAISDIIVGCITGEWNWEATSAVWKKWIMPWVGYDWTTKVFDLAYEHNFLGWKKNNELAYEWAKRGSTVYSICKGVGYYAAMIVATIFTAGAASAVTGVTAVGSVSVNTIAQGAVAATASLGKNTQINYNKTIDSKVKEYYISETLKANSGLTLEEATVVVEENLANNVYSDNDTVRKNAMDNISGGEIVGSVGKAAGTAVIDGGIYFAAGAAGDTIKSYKTALDYGKGIGAGDAIGKNAKNVINFAVKHKDGITTTIKASKAYISEGYNSLIDGDEFDWKGATLDATSIVIAENLLRGVKSNGTLKKGLYSTGSEKNVVDSSTEYALSKLTNGEYIPSTKVTDAMTAFKEETSKTGFKALKENFVEISTDALKKGLEKGEEKLIKDITSQTYDSVIDVVGVV